MTASVLVAIVVANLGFLVFFPALWLGVTALLSLLGGWSALAKIFGSDDPMVPQFSFQSGQFGFVSYRRCLSAQIGVSGLHLSVFLLFKFRHPPLLIPWSEIESVTASKKFYGTAYTLVVRRTNTRISFYGGLGKAIYEYWKAQGGDSGID